MPASAPTTQASVHTTDTERIVALRRFAEQCPGGDDAVDAMARDVQLLVAALDRADRELATLRHAARAVARAADAALNHAPHNRNPAAVTAFEQAHDTLRMVLDRRPS